LDQEEFSGCYHSPQPLDVTTPAITYWQGIAAPTRSGRWIK
jgi:hypothetical protein